MTLAAGGIVRPTPGSSHPFPSSADAAELVLPLPNPSNRAALAELVRLFDEGLGT